MKMASLRTREAAAYIGISKSMLEQSRTNGNLGIPYIKLGTRSVRYRIEDLDAYLKSLPAYTSTSEEKSGRQS